MTNKKYTLKMHKMKLIFLKKNLLQITLCHIFLKNRHSFDHSNTTREFKKSTKQQNKKTPNNS